MRLAQYALLLAICLAIPGGVAARGKPEPIPCPADVVAAVAAACPCDGSPQPDSSIVPWRNHGEYVRCVVHLRNQYRKSDCLDDTLKRSLARCAARSTCGKDGKVLCCTYDLGTCSDPTPDAVKAGVCNNDAAVACDVAADCTKSKASIAPDGAACAERGGVDVGPGSVCTPCPPPPAP